MHSIKSLLRYSTFYTLRFVSFLTRLIPRKGEQPLQGMKLLKKETEKNKTHIGKLFRKRQKKKGFY